jgi:hypothetical protein
MGIRVGTWDRYIRTFARRPTAHILCQSCAFGEVFLFKLEGARRMTLCRAWSSLGLHLKGDAHPLCVSREIPAKVNSGNRAGCAGRQTLPMYTRALSPESVPSLGMSLEAQTRSTPFLSSFEGSRCDCGEDLSQSSVPNIHFLGN